MWRSPHREVPRAMQNSLRRHIRQAVAGAMLHRAHGILDTSFVQENLDGALRDIRAGPMHMGQKHCAELRPAFARELLHAP